MKAAYGVVIILVVGAVGVAFWLKHDSRPLNIPNTAILVEGQYVNCTLGHSRSGTPCKVYDKEGNLLDSDPFLLRLTAFAKNKREIIAICGQSSLDVPASHVAECVLQAFKEHKPFVAEYVADFGTFYSGYGIAGDGAGTVVMATYDSRGFPDVRPSSRTELFDGNRIRLERCVEPITLDQDDHGAVGCVIPVNEGAPSELSTEVIDTTICAIAQNPAAFNNKMVRIKGHYSGNFEYSMFSGDGCPAIWFTYASNDSPPGLAIHIPGQGTSGGEDERGWGIKPVPITLVKDKNFQKFQRLMNARIEANKRSLKDHPDGSVSYQVTATVVGRIDGVSQAVHEFHKKRVQGDRADYLGFGQMGLFDAQFVLQSVEGDAVLERELR